MFPQLASTAASLTRASSLMLKAGTDAHLYDDPHDADIVRLLDSKFDLEKVEALKRLLALMSQGVDVSSFFPQVVKNVASSSLEVKKLVYIYLVHYAEKRPDEALLSINTFQKDLVDFNPLVRAWALRAMCGIRVHAVAPLMIIAIQKCAKDPSPYVRRCAANAIPKLYALNREQYLENLEELICMLLDDDSAGVVGAAAAAFTIVCPENHDVILPRFQGLCDALLNVEEWGQILLVDILLRYVIARHGYFRERARFGGDTRAECDISKDGRKNEISNDSLPQNAELLLQCSLPLLQSQNSGVVLAVVAVYWLLATETSLRKIVKPILFLLRSTFDSQYVVMMNLSTLVEAKPDLFEDFYEEFFIRSSDIYEIREMKLNILSLIANEVSIHVILRELQAYVRDPDRKFAAKAVSVIGKCAGRHPTISSICMEGLLSLARGNHIAALCFGNTMQSKQTDLLKITALRNSRGPQNSIVLEDREAAVVTQAVLAIRHIASLHFKEVEKILARLVRDLDLIWVTTARSVVIWMIGEYGSKSAIIREMLPTVFSYLAACFTNEELESKLQILNCILKVFAQSCQDIMSQFKITLCASSYILDLGSCDFNYDVRDRARMLKQIMGMHIKSISLDDSRMNPLRNDISSNNLGRSSFLNELKSDEASKDLFMALFLSSEKLMPASMTVQQDRVFSLGSMSHIVHHCAPGYRPLPLPCSLEVDQPASHFVNLEDFLVTKQTEQEDLDEESDNYESFSNSSDTQSNDKYPKFKNSMSGNGLSQSNGSDDDDTVVSDEGSNGSYHGQPDSPKIGPLINLFDDDEVSCSVITRSTDALHQSDEIGSVLRSSQDLEVWLTSDELQSKCQGLDISTDYAAFTLGPIRIEPTKKILLDFTNGDGLEVKYSYSFEIDESHQSMVRLNLCINNKSEDILSTIYVCRLESDTAFSGTGMPLEVSSVCTVIPSHVVTTLNPQETLEEDLFLDLQQQLSPVKLAVYCNTKCYPVTLVPDIGAFLRRKELMAKDFAFAESRLKGMFEIIKRTSMTKPIEPHQIRAEQEEVVLTRTIAARVLSHVNVHLVTVLISLASGSFNDEYSVQLKFSGETLVDCKLCLITITLGLTSSNTTGNRLELTVKVNSEDSIFGVNISERLLKAIVENK